MKGKLLKIENILEVSMLKKVGDFEHEALPKGHRLREHCLYRRNKEAYCNLQYI